MPSEEHRVSPSPPAGNANDYIEQQLDRGISDLASVFEAATIAFNGPLVRGVDDLLRTAIEKKVAENPQQSKAVMVLTTIGGQIETVHRIVDTLRQHYKTVEFVVPNYAYSAGTILVMSGDAIHMDYYSRLGPIDPQVPTASGDSMLPALGYLERYEALIKKAQNGNISTAEVQLLLRLQQ